MVFLDRSYVFTCFSLCRGGGIGTEGNTTNEPMTTITNPCDENFESTQGLLSRYMINNTLDGTDLTFVFKASTCFPETDFDTTLSLYSGSIDKLICVDGIERDDYSTSYNNHKCSTITWTAGNKEPYYILVHGRQPDQTGNFYLEVRHTKVESQDGDDISNTNFESQDDDDDDDGIVFAYDDIVFPPSFESQDNDDIVFAYDGVAASEAKSGELSNILLALLFGMFPVLLV